jgi:hypothetical protein
VKRVQIPDPFRNKRKVSKEMTLNQSRTCTMQETEFKYSPGSSRSCLSPYIKLVSLVESHRVQLIKDLTLALFSESLAG